MESNGTPQLTFTLSLADLQPLIERAVGEALARFDAAHPSDPGPICYTEAVAAHLLGLEPHQLRDERYRGRIKAHQVVGNRVRYLREDLLAYATARPWKAQDLTTSSQPPNQCQDEETK